VSDHASPALCGARDPNTLVRAGRCDSADSQPCIGTAAAIQWTLKATGYLFHSGLPHKGINSLELGSEAVVRAPPAPPPAPAVAATSAERCGGAPGGAPEAFLRGLPRARTGEGLRLCDAVHDEADTDQVRGGGREPAAAVDRVPGKHSRLQRPSSLGCVFTPMPRCLPGGHQADAVLQRRGVPEEGGGVCRGHQRQAALPADARAVLQVRDQEGGRRGLQGIDRAGVERRALQGCARTVCRLLDEHEVG